MYKTRERNSIKNTCRNLSKLSAVLKSNRLNVIFLTIVSFMLSGCDSGPLAPKGLIAITELNLFWFSGILMLFVVIPVILMALWFAWRYRDAGKAKYTPEWTHSTRLEIVWWAIPCIIILILGTVTWKTTHSLDPYKPLDSKVKPVKIEVISLDWKWLFIYPEYNIATVNYLQIPVNTPIDFKITAASPMNSFIIPQLGGQIYAMTGMTTQLHLLAHEPGVYRGLGTNYTGIGFADMHFDAKVTSESDFTHWVNGIKENNDKKLDSGEFWGKLVPPSMNYPVSYFGKIENGLFDEIVMHYMMPEPHHEMNHEMGHTKKHQQEQE
jgi:cytochrome o ubiquinol oxidase subunit 2